jgi:hypothetical protein
MLHAHSSLRTRKFISRELKVQTSMVGKNIPDIMPFVHSPDYLIFPVLHRSKDEYLEGK